jgi:hypothetical protein
MKDNSWVYYINQVAMRPTANKQKKNSEKAKFGDIVKTILSCILSDEA